MIRLVLAGLLALACAAPTPTVTPTTSATPTSGCPRLAVCDPTPPVPMPLPDSGQQLAAGTYTKSDFAPPLTFTVDTGWTTVQQFPGFFDIQDVPGSLDVVAVQFTVATGFESAEDAAADIEGRAHLLVGPRKTIAFRQLSGDLPGIRLIVDTTDPADSDPVIFRPVLTTPPGPISIGSGRRLEVNLFTVSDGVLAILVGGSVAKWDRAEQLSTPVLESVVIGQ